MQLSNRFNAVVTWGISSSFKVANGSICFWIYLSPPEKTCKCLHIYGRVALAFLYARKPRTVIRHFLKAYNTGFSDRKVDNWDFQLLSHLLILQTSEQRGWEGPMKVYYYLLGLFALNNSVDVCVSGQYCIPGIETTLNEPKFSCGCTGSHIGLRAELYCTCSTTKCKTHFKYVSLINI